METKTAIKIIVKANGKRAAYYRSPNSKHWFSMTVPHATQALREGKTHLGINPNVEVFAA